MLRSADIVEALGDWYRQDPAGLRSAVEKLVWKRAGGTADWVGPEGMSELKAAVLEHVIDPDSLTTLVAGLRHPTDGYRHRRHALARVAGTLSDRFSKRIAREEARRSPVDPALPAGGHDEDAVQGWLERVTFWEMAVVALTAPELEILRVLCAADGDAASAAEALGVPVGTVRVRRHRILVAMRAAFPGERP